MNQKTINREIRKVSNFSSLPVLIFLVLQQVVSLAENAVIRAMQSGGIEIGYDVCVLIAYCAQYFIAAGLAIFIFYKARGKSTGLRLRQAFGKPQKSLGWILKWFIITFAFTYIANYTVTIIRLVINGVFKIEASTPDFDFGNSALGTFSMFFALSVLAPLFEEMLFRATVYRNTEIMGQFFAIMFSGIMFGIWHMNYAQIFYAAVMGFFMAFITAKTRSIIPTIIYHCLSNTLSGIVSLLMNSSGNQINMDIDSIQNLFQGGSEALNDNLPSLLIMSLFGYAIMGLLIAGIVLFIVTLVKHRRRKKFMDGIFPVKGFKKLAVFFSAPITIITLILMIAGTVVRALQ